MSDISDFDFSRYATKSNAQNVAASLLGIGIIIVIIWANVQGKSLVWTKANALTAFVISIAAFAIWNTPFVGYVEGLLRPILGNLSILGVNVIHFIIFFFVAISVSYWANNWLYPKIQGQDNQLKPITPATVGPIQPAVGGAYNGGPYMR